MLDTPGQTERLLIKDFSGLFIEPQRERGRPVLVGLPLHCVSLSLFLIFSELPQGSPDKSTISERWILCTLTLITAALGDPAAPPQHSRCSGGAVPAGGLRENKQERKHHIA